MVSESKPVKKHVLGARDGWEFAKGFWSFTLIVIMPPVVIVVGCALVFLAS